MRPEVPTVLFVCIQNAGRSQIAEALFNNAAEGRALARSAGTAPAARIHPEVVATLAELSLDIAGSHPKALTTEGTQDVDFVVTMGCGDECPVVPGAQMVDWDIRDPAGHDADTVREIRDEIARGVADLLAEIV